MRSKSSNQTSDPFMEVLEHRRKHLREFCRFNASSIVPFYRERDGRHGSRNFYFNSSLKLLQCYVYKVASKQLLLLHYSLNKNPSTWVFNQLFMRNSVDVLLHEVENLEIRSSFETILSRKLLQHSLRHVIIVREPFLRFISAYRDKILGPTDHYEYFFSLLGRRILQTYVWMTSLKKGCT